MREASTPLKDHKKILRHMNAKPPVRFAMHIQTRVKDTIFPFFQRDFRCFEKDVVYVRLNINGILLLKRWRSRIGLPRRTRRKRLQQLELNLWPKDRRNRSKRF